jgi:hypothetical protein
MIMNKMIAIALFSVIMTIVFLSTSWAMTESEYDAALGRCAVIAEGEKLGLAEPKTCYQCYWIAQAASVNMKSRDGKFMAKQLMKIFVRYKDY